MAWKITLNRYDNIIETIIRDSAGGKLETFKCRACDYPRIVKLINRKFGIEEDKLNKIKSDQDKDLEWLKEI